MLNSKFDLYKTEWLDLVFADRNKTYGAYELRKHYSNYVMRAMAITIAAFALGIGLIKILNKPQDQTIYKRVEYEHHPYIPSVPPEKKEIIHEAVKSVHTKVAPQKAMPRPATQMLTVPKVTDQPVLEDKFTPQSQLVNPGLTTDKGTDEPVKTIIDTEPENGKAGGGNGTAPSNEPVDAMGVDVMPEPVGGMAAWSKFLQRNIRYPDTDAQGKVYLSFIIEKDGKISNITLSRGVDKLLDDEALRVLRLAPAWKPGFQQGQPVRVKYTLPISFQQLEQ